MRPHVAFSLILMAVLLWSQINVAAPSLESSHDNIQSGKGGEGFASGESLCLLPVMKTILRTFLGPVATSGSSSPAYTGPQQCEIGFFSNGGWALY